MTVVFAFHQCANGGLRDLPNILRTFWNLNDLANRSTFHFDRETFTVRSLPLRNVPRGRVADIACFYLMRARTVKARGHPSIILE